MEVNLKNSDLNFGDMLTSPLWRKTKDAQKMRLDPNLVVTTGNDTPTHLQDKMLQSQWKRTTQNNFHRTTNSIWGRRIYTSEGERGGLKAQEAVKQNTVNNQRFFRITHSSQSNRKRLTSNMNLSQLFNLPQEYK